MTSTANRNATPTKAWARIFMGIGLLLGLTQVVMPEKAPFERLVALCEGQRFDGLPSQYVPDADGKELAGEELPQIGFELLEAQVAYDDSGVVSELSSRIRVQAAGVSQELVVAPDAPAQVGDVTVALQHVGLAPLFSIFGPGLPEPVTTCVNLNIWAQNSPPDDFVFPGLGVRFVVRFFPDYVATPEGPTSASMQLNNPAFEVRVVDEQTDEVFGLAVIAVGEGMRWGNTRMVVRDLRRWAMLRVSTTPRGPWLLYLAAAIFALGAVMRLVARWSTGDREHDA